MDRTAGAPARLPMTLGRFAALALGVPLCLVLIANTGYSLIMHIGRGTLSVNYPVPVSAGRVSVSLGGGDVLLRQAAGSQGTLSGTGYYSLVRPRITHRFAKDGASFGFDCAALFGGCGLNSTLSVPPGTTVSVSTDGGNVTADGITGQVWLRTDGGDLTADRVTGDLTLSTDGGDIAAEGVSAARVVASSGGGDITIVFTTVPRDVQVGTDGGDITIVVPSGNAVYNVTERTAGGSTAMEVPYSPHSPNVITATSGGGDITVRQAD